MISSQIYSESVPGRSRISQVNLVRIVEEAVRDICDVCHVLEPRYSNDSASDSESHPNIIIEHVFPFVDLDHSLLADNRIEQRESSLISYESNLFENAGTNSILRYGDVSTVNLARKW